VVEASEGRPYHCHATVRIRLINQQAESQAPASWTRLCAQIVPSEEDEAGQHAEQARVVILTIHGPGPEGPSSPLLLRRGSGQHLRRGDYQALRSLSGVGPQ